MECPGELLRRKVYASERLPQLNCVPVWAGIKKAYSVVVDIRLLFANN